MVPLKPLLKSRVAWGRTMWDWPRMEARLYNSFVVVEFKIVPFPFVITVFSWLIKGGFMMRKWPLTLYIVHSNTNKQSLELILTLCQTKTLCITAPPQNTIPRPMTTEVTMAGVSLKCRKVKRTIPGKIFRQKSFWNKRFINKNLDWFGMRCTKKTLCSLSSQFTTKNGETTEIAQFLQNHQSFNIQSLDNKASFAKYTKLSYDGCEVSNLLVAFKIKRECPGRQVLSDSYKRDAIVKKDFWESFNSTTQLDYFLYLWYDGPKLEFVNQSGKPAWVFFILTKVRFLLLWFWSIGELSVSKEREAL